jgi:hypothetical protein
VQVERDAATAAYGRDLAQSVKSETAAHERVDGALERAMVVRHRLRPQRLRALVLAEVIADKEVVVVFERPRRSEWVQAQTSNVPPGSSTRAASRRAGSNCAT